MQTLVQRDKSCRMIDSYNINHNTTMDMRAITAPPNPLAATTDLIRVAAEAMQAVAPSIITSRIVTREQ